jgi:hypothetical protein
MLFAVEDFSTAVPAFSQDQQERKVASQLDSQGLVVVTGTPDARKTCQLDKGWSGSKPAIVLRYEMSDLNNLPAEVTQKVNSGKYHSAAVGACGANGSSEFARFRIAILLF